MPRRWWQLPSCLCRIDLLILPRRRCCWLGDPWTLGLFEKGRGTLCPGGTQKGKETGWGWGFTLRSSSPCTASSWAERFEASLWDFLLVAFHLLRAWWEVWGTGSENCAQVMRALVAATKPSACLHPHPRLPVTALQAGCRES